MSGRKLGGGRILGSGKGLLPPPKAAAVPRPPSPYTPSESSISIDSSAVSPSAKVDLSELDHDLGARIRLGSQADVASPGPSGLTCPICSEEMMTLLQLNRHIDDNHQELPAEEQDEVKTWFDKQVLKAKRFQPLSIINQKLRGLEVFESNESAPVLPTPALTTTSSSRPSIDGPIDPDELISRNHWQRSTSYDICTDPTCGRNLGTMNGSINCRHCGRLFCEEHTMYQMKLSRSAAHEPMRGYWARVCETCYKSREGYNDHSGVLMDRTAGFVAARRKRVERHNLEISRLEKRLTKLTHLLANPPEHVVLQSGGYLSQVGYLNGQKNWRKSVEQSVVTWEEDESVAQCPFCKQEFGSWTFRRHHCRICGRVVCADVQTGCSSDIGLNVNDGPKSEKPLVNTTNDQLSLDIRMCRECKDTIFSNRDFADSITHKPPDHRAYENLLQFEKGIRLLLPTFHRVLLALQPEKSDTGEIDLSQPPPTHAQIQEAAKVRRRLVDAFTKYSQAAKRMRDLKTESAAQQRLQAAVYTHANNFLHTNMLPLKALPQLLRSRSIASAPARLLSTPNHSLSSLRHTETASSETEGSRNPSESGTGTVDGDNSSSVDSGLRDGLIVLEEQQFMVEGMIRTAREARRFEEVAMLTRNKEELDAEIGKMREDIVRAEGG